ncbi:hypothetical protein [Methylobacterium iners]|uniref:Uncharacterized protein n=1 Tax=Methylobacterium iners TaxID=418707 RepID=A0ABQ4RXV1_9HYPH|nr:hypothetical protein [Methylobacterium iners]GJD95215.1 hypothetical protein OCOJLMKI_2425 [Methylobacterium iners]
MNAPLDHAAFGTLEKLRETAREQLHLCAFHCSLAVDHGEVRADAGMTYNTRRAVAHMRFAIDALKMMAEHQDRSTVDRSRGDAS